AVLEAADAKALREVLASHPVDLILLDQRLPDADGLVLARELRAASDVGIIIITGFGQPVDRILGLELGADDYVAKPVDLRELLARIRSVLRRRSPRLADTPDALSFEGWNIDPSARRLTAPTGDVVDLTSGEFDLLMVFARQPNRVLSRDEIMNALHHREAGPYDRAIDVQVGRLRRKIEPDPARPALIKSVRGAGYLFAPKVRHR
ncbi:MAG: winged helix-turn-helix domain-containing protein, partial [Betaproteobacteria bacterium]|nr:winged helix-turn-helix domain-containing protein [Betaproteobacteria bacterium]